MTPEMALSDMDRWSIGGYFDREILQIFSESIRNIEVPKKEERSHTKQEAVSAHRKKYYREYVSSWYKLVEKLRAIEDGYEKV